MKDRVGTLIRAVFSRRGILILIGLASTIPYLYAYRLQDLRLHTNDFLIAFLTAFVLYAIATAIVIRNAEFERYTITVIFGCAAIYNFLMILTPPSLSDDMYRYIWDGRLQSHDISPYQFSPDAFEVRNLRDGEIWTNINRKSAVTIYPPLAEMTYALLWRIIPDNIQWFQAFMSGMSFLAAALLAGLLRALGRPSERVLIFLWSPLLIFETAHSAHVDALALPLLVGALLARVRERDGWVGFLLGAATAVKFYPALLFPALWRPKDARGRWLMPATFILSLVVPYLPYLMKNGLGVIGFLPTYLTERFNISPPLYWLLRNIPHDRLADSQGILNLVTLGLLGVISLVMVLRPARNGEKALLRCLLPISILTLLNPNLFSWYLLWLLPFLAIFLMPGKVTFREKAVGLPLRFDAWSGWWLFTGLVSLSYTFFIQWKPVPWAIHLQFWPLYTFLAVDLIQRVWTARFNFLSTETTRLHS